MPDPRPNAGHPLPLQAGEDELLAVATELCRYDSGCAGFNYEPSNVSGERVVFKDVATGDDTFSSGACPGHGQAYCSFCTSPVERAAAQGIRKGAAVGRRCPR